MDRSLKDADVLVVGGTGSIGKAVVAALLREGAHVRVLTRYERRARHKLADLLQEYNSKDIEDDRLDISETDVIANKDLWKVHHFFHVSEEDEGESSLNAIVYTVGHCPPGGFDEAVKTPLTEQTGFQLRQELDLHVIGLGNVASELIPCLMPGGHLLVISSAITRLTDEQCPPWLHAGHYAAAKAAQDELVRWLRRDPLVKENKILIHRLAPAAVDTPFHQGCKHSPPAMLPVEEVACHVLRALQSNVIVDEMLTSHTL